MIVNRNRSLRYLLIAGGLAIILSVVSHLPCTAQQKLLENKVKTHRILFISDGSGSMKSKWNDQKKIKAARQLLVDVADSISRVNNNVEFGLRVFGHQSPRSKKDCKDSKLEVDFSANSAPKIKRTLKEINPQGYSPIAYSLYQCLKDFPQDPTAKNSIILITDGLENCKGDMCKAGRAIKRRGITIRPFIIGLGLKKGVGEAFDCVGEYHDAATKKDFKETLNVVVSRAMNKTTTQVYLLNAYDKPKETNVEMTFYDSYSGKVRHNFVHTMDENGIPDTLYLSPSGKYDLTVHTTPAVEKKEIEIIPGKHNIIPVRTPLGALKITSDERGRSAVGIQTVISKPRNRETITLQDMNTEKRYITGQYHVEVLTIPRISKNIKIQQDKTKEIKVPRRGKLEVKVPAPGLGSIYKIESQQKEKVYEFEKLKQSQTIRLLPGEYRIVYRPKRAFDINETQSEKIEITSGEDKMIRF